MARYAASIWRTTAPGRGITTTCEAPLTATVALRDRRDDVVGGGGIRALPTEEPGYVGREPAKASRYWRAAIPMVSLIVSWSAVIRTARLGR
ncbi:hypothetical protein SNL152K_7141 [Streptomyces sp. NL15-2K]|nr:hypothetical protein SNL152K_7141 [Streptomyces sp. NL15-2K]